MPDAALFQAPEHADPQSTSPFPLLDFIPVWTSTIGGL